MEGMWVEVLYRGSEAGSLGLGGGFVRMGS